MPQVERQPNEVLLAFFAEVRRLAQTARQREEAERPQSEEAGSPMT